MKNLKDLKVGDKVILETGGWCHLKSVGTVEKITQKGKGYIKVCGELYVINDDGTEASVKGDNQSKLYPYTEEEGKRISEARYISSVKRKMNDFNGKLTFEQAKQISEILNLI